MNLQTGMGLLISLQIVIDLILIVAFVLVYRRLRLLNPKRLDRLIQLLKEKESLVSDVLSRSPVNEENTRASVIQMFRAGKSKNEISNILGLSEAEVELILQMESTRKSH